MELTVTKREAKIKNPGRKSLRGITIPAVLYNYEQNELLSLERTAFEKLFPKLKPNSILTLKLPDTQKKVVVKDYAFSLKNHRIFHVDFYALGNKKLKLYIPLAFKGLPVGISKGGIIRRSAERVWCSCEPTAIPSAIEVDISRLDLDDCIYLKELPKIEGLEYLESVNKALVSVIITSKAASKVKSEEDQEDKPVAQQGQSK